MAVRARGATFDVFLCHNSADKAEVGWIARGLRKLGLNPWLDEEQLRPGRPWRQAIEDQIASMRSAAVFIGRNGQGPWQNIEIDALLHEFARRQRPIIPVLLSECPSHPELPLFMRGFMWVDFRKRSPDPMKQLRWGITGGVRRAPATPPSQSPRHIGAPDPFFGARTLVVEELSRDARRLERERNNEKIQRQPKYLQILDAFSPNQPPLIAGRWDSDDGCIVLIPEGDRYRFEQFDSRFVEVGRGKATLEKREGLDIVQIDDPHFSFMVRELRVVGDLMTAKDNLSKIVYRRGL